MSSKPVLLGMNSPQSTDPSMAFYPWNGQASGARLIGMIQDAAEELGFYFAPEAFLSIFDRRNVLNQKSWDVSLARAVAPSLHEELLGRMVIVCGRQVQRVMNYDHLPWMVWNAPHDEVRYCMIPHPSGLSREYNDPEMRRKVGHFLLNIAANYVS